MQDKNKIDYSITLKRGREHSLKKKHHWIFSGAIEKIDGSPNEGDLVWIKTNKGQNIGYGFYGTRSIAIRILSFNPKISPTDQLTQCLFNALKHRQKLGLTESIETNSYRLFHSEGDLIPGLTIDKFASHFVIQIHHDGIRAFLPIISKFLLEQFKNTTSIILKLGKSTIDKENFEFLFGSSSECEILENNIKFKVNIIEGQKTGFFLDQRKNRRILASYARDKKILNLFCYTGGFSIYALCHGAKNVVSVDSSKSALNIAENNISLNHLQNTNYLFLEQNCEDYLNQSTETFDIVICDPPALVKNRHHLHQGLKHYHKLQTLSLKKVNSGGLFFTFSCSQFVSNKDLLKQVTNAASELKLKLEKIKDLKQAPCHLVNKNHPESMYLKGFVFKVL